jgi:hypothetical protein
MADKTFDDWQSAKTVAERLVIVTAALERLEAKISADFAFLTELGYGAPVFSCKNVGAEGIAAGGEGYSENAPHLECVYIRRGRSVTVAGDFNWGFIHAQVTLSELAEDGSVRDYFTYEAYRRHAKRRDPGIEYFEKKRPESLTDFYLSAVKEDLLTVLREVALGNEWLSLETKDFKIMVGPPETKEDALAKAARQELEKLRAQSPVALMLEAPGGPPRQRRWRCHPSKGGEFLYAVAHKDTGLELWDPAKSRRTPLDPLENFVQGRISLYWHAPYLCAVADYGLTGIVIDIQTGRKLPLSREYYYSEHCCFPIAFLEHEGETLLVHGTAWNRLDFTRLRDFTLLTEREETKENGIDYFLSSLFVSPKQRQFAANGWVWQPSDNIRVYEVTDFFRLYDQASCVLAYFDNGTGYNWDRPACFCGEGLLAVAHNPAEGENVASPSVIELYDTTQIREEPYSYSYGDMVNEGTYKYYQKCKTIPFDGVNKSRAEDQDPTFTPVCNEVSGELYFDHELRLFITVGKQKGLYIADMEGRVLAQNLAYADYQYCPGLRYFYLFKGENRYSHQVVSLEEILVESVGRCWRPRRTFV